MAPIIEFFLQLVAMERFLVELTTINQKVHNWAHVQSDMIERRDPLYAVFSQNLRRVDFQYFLGLLQYSWQQSAATDGVCEHNNTSQVYFLTLNLFKQCEPLQGILVQNKSE